LDIRNIGTPEEIFHREQSEVKEIPAYLSSKNPSGSTHYPKFALLDTREIDVNLNYNLRKTLNVLDSFPQKRRKVSMNRPKTFFTFMLIALFLVGVISTNAQGQAPEVGQKGPPAGQEPAYAKPYPMGQVTITLTTVAAGIGYEWGKGALTYKGQQYTFKVKGLQILGVGIKKATVKGDVYNLFDIGQFPGPYVAVKAGAAVIKGKEGLIVQNQQGVRLRLVAEQKGLSVNIGPEGFTIELERAL
jgi:hypothetical protein